MILRKIQPFVDLFRAVQIALLEAEGGVEYLGRGEILRVADPGYVSDRILWPFLDVNIENKPFFVVGVGDRVLDDARVAIAAVAIELDQLVLVFVELVLVELRLTENFPPPGVLRGLLQHAAELVLLEGAVAMKADFFDDDLRAFVNGEHHLDLVVANVLKAILRARRQESLCRVLLFDPVRGVQKLLVADTPSGAQIGGFQQLLCFELVVACDFNAVKKRKLGDGENQLDVAIAKIALVYLDVTEILQVPKVLHRTGNLLSGNVDLLIDLDGQAFEQLRLLDGLKSAEGNLPDGEGAAFRHGCRSRGCRGSSADWRRRPGFRFCDGCGCGKVEQGQNDEKC